MANGGTSPAPTQTAMGTETKTTRSNPVKSPRATSATTPTATTTARRPTRAPTSGATTSTTTAPRALVGGIAVETTMMETVAAIRARISMMTMTRYSMLRTTARLESPAGFHSPTSTATEMVAEMPTKIGTTTVTGYGSSTLRVMSSTSAPAPHSTRLTKSTHMVAAQVKLTPMATESQT